MKEAAKSIDQVVRQCVAESNSRSELWINLIKAVQVKHMAEVGVYRGDFASQLLGSSDSIETYYMIDPWKHLDDWQKPANKSNSTFEQFLSETKEKTDFAAEQRKILRGKTTEVIEQIGSEELDLAYIDGDHTLKGITIDLISLFPKIRTGGFIGGDDFSQTIWQHMPNYEPTLVFPFAVYFAEAQGATIYALPYSQFLLAKNGDKSFSFVDLTGNYNSVGLKSQFNPVKVLTIKLTEAVETISTLLTKAIDSYRQKQKK